MLLNFANNKPIILRILLGKHIKQYISVDVSLYIRSKITYMIFSKELRNNKFIVWQPRSCEFFPYFYFHFSIFFILPYYLYLPLNFQYVAVWIFNNLKVNKNWMFHSDLDMSIIFTIPNNKQVFSYKLMQIIVEFTCKWR